MCESSPEIPFFRYSFNDGPLPEPDLHRPILSGNCRLLVQLFFERVYGKFYCPEKLLNPEAYESLGTFVKKPQDDPKTFFDGLKTGHVIYAQRIANRLGEPVDDFSIAALGSVRNWTIRMHTAIFLNDPRECADLLSPEIPSIGVNVGQSAVFHATSIQGSNTLWPTTTFERFYRPIAAKQF